MVPAAVVVVVVVVVARAVLAVVTIARDCHPDGAWDGLLAKQRQNCTGRPFNRPTTACTAPRDRHGRGAVTKVYGLEGFFVLYIRPSLVLYPSKAL